MARAKVNRRKPTKPAQPVLTQIPWRGLVTAVLLLGIAGLLFHAAQFALNRPVRTLHVQASFQRVTPIQVEQAVSDQLGRGFLGANLRTLSTDVEALEWVDDVDVERRWPDSLVVRIGEQVAAARWGATGLLNRRGELFAERASHLFPELPQLSGPMGSEQRVAQRYLNLRGRLAAANLGLSLLVLDDRGSWSFQLEDGTEVRIGRRDFSASWYRRWQRNWAVSNTSIFVTPTVLPSVGALEKATPTLG